MHGEFEVRVGLRLNSDIQFIIKYFQAVKLRQSIYGEQHAITKRTLDLFTVIYAEMGKEQYSGMNILVWLCGSVFVLFCVVAVDVSSSSSSSYNTIQYNTIQLYFTTLATHNKSWFPGGA